MLIKKIFSILICASILASTSVNVYGNEKPTIHGTSAITIDVQTGEIIYDLNIDEKAYPASITKLMTAILLAENKQKDDLIPYTQEAKEQIPYSIDNDIKPMEIGEEMKASEVMKALLVFSANDSAMMIASSVSGNVQSFVDLMNKKATELNMKNSHFTSPNGLHNDDHYTTAYDLTLLAREDLKIPWVTETMILKNTELNFLNDGSFPIENRNKNVGVDGCIGGKTGFTDESGRCLVAMYERDGRVMVGVVLKSVYDADDSFVFDDMKSIIDWSYNQTKEALIKKDSVVDTKTVAYKPLRFFGPTKTIEIPFVVKEDVSYYKNSTNDNEIKKEAVVNAIDPWKLSNEKEMGEYVVSQRESKNSYKLYSTITTKNIIEENKMIYIITGLCAFLCIVLFILLFTYIGKRGKRSRRRKRH